MKLKRLSLFLPLAFGLAFGAFSKLSIAPSFAAPLQVLALPRAVSPPLPFERGAVAQAFVSQLPKLDPEKLGRSLDQGDIAGAVQQIELGWQRQFEEYYQGALTSKLVSVDQITRILSRNERKTGERSALIYVVPTLNHLELILIAPGGSPIHRRVTTASRTTLLEMAKTFRNDVSNPTAATNYLPASQTLYQWMIAPLVPELEARRVNTLIFCLGGGLRSLPVAALHDGQQFLIEKYGLSIIPAFNLLDNRVSRWQNDRVLAMGASEFKDQGPLPGVPLELSAVGNLWKGERWLNQDFTVANLKARRIAYPFEIIHLATHAKFLPGDARQSYIQFWDAQLSQDQLKNLGLREPAVELLVLSACQTALGDAQAELGFAGLAVQSGSKAALASLWAVSDTGTLALMTAFYQQLRSAPVKGEALRQAQIAMLKGQLNSRGNSSTLPLAATKANEGNYVHPYYWSAFTLVGNPW